MIYKTTIPRSLFETHESDAVVFTCVDPRFFEATLVRFATADKSLGGLGLKIRDPLIIPGVCKGLAEGDQVIMDFTRHFLDLVIPAHSINQIIAVHHPTCAAYGIKDAEKESETQRADMRRGVEILKEWYPWISFSEFFIEAGEPQGEDIPLTYRPV